MIIDTSDEVIKEMRKAARKGCRKIAKEIAKDTISHAPNRRGDTRKSIYYGARISGHTGQASGKVGYYSKRKLKQLGFKFKLNWAWLENGTKPHLIVFGGKRRDGLKKNVLANKTLGLKGIFGKFANHPGSNPVPMMAASGRRIAPSASSIASGELKILSETNDKLMQMKDDGDDEIN